MSNISNTNLIERASELAEEITNHPSGYDKLLLNAIKANDLTEVSRLVSVVESGLAQEHFHNFDLGVY